VLCVCRVIMVKVTLPPPVQGWKSEEGYIKQAEYGEEIRALVQQHGSVWLHFKKQSGNIRRYRVHTVVCQDPHTRYGKWNSGHVLLRFTVVEDKTEAAQYLPGEEPVQLGEDRHTYVERVLFYSYRPVQVP
jgi:hypothetical protein